MNEKIQEKKTPPFILSVRFLTGILLFFGYCFQYMLKINMSIAIVCMVNGSAVLKQQQQHHETINESHAISECNSNHLSHGSHFDGQFVWSKSTQGLILSSYFYGYLVSQIPGGYFSYKFGGKTVLFITMLVASVLTIIIPFLSRWNYIALMICRLLIGLAHGAFWPAVSSLWAHWAPLNERNRLVGMATSGAWVGNIIALPFGSFLCVSGFDGGWPSIFYIFGILSAVWCILFFLLTSDSPQTHRFASQIEKDYVLSHIKKSTNLKTPWLEIMKSRASIVIFIANFSSNWGLYLFLTQLPTFLRDVLKFDIKSNGLISALPYVVTCIVNVASSIISDFLIQKNLLTRTNVRRLFGSLGLFVPMIAIICLSFITCKYSSIGVLLLVIGISFTGCSFGAGYIVNISDVAGSYAGVLLGISNCISTLPGIISPYLVGYLTPKQTQKEWQIVFIISAVIYFIGGVTYLTFCDGNKQHWALSDEEKLEKETKK